MSEDGWFTFDPLINPGAFSPILTTHPEIQTVAEPVAEPEGFSAVASSDFSQTTMTITMTIGGLFMTITMTIQPKSTANHDYNNTHRVTGGLFLQISHQPLPLLAVLNAPWGGHAGSSELGGWTLPSKGS